MTWEILTNFKKTLSFVCYCYGAKIMRGLKLAKVQKQHSNLDLFNALMRFAVGSSFMNL